MFNSVENGAKSLMRLIKPKAEDIFLQTVSMWVFQFKSSSIDTPRDFVEDTCSMGKLLMVREGLSDSKLLLRIRF